MPKNFSPTNDLDNCISVSEQLFLLPPHQTRLNEWNPMKRLPRRPSMLLSKEHLQRHEQHHQRKFCNKFTCCIFSILIRNCNQDNVQTDLFCTNIHYFSLLFFLVRDIVKYKQDQCSQTESRHRSHVGNI